MSDQPKIPRFFTENKKGKKTFLDAILMDGDSEASIKALNTGVAVEARTAHSMRLIATLMRDYDIPKQAMDSDSFKAAVVELECRTYGGVPKKDNPTKRDGGATLPMEWSVVKSELRSYVRVCKQPPWVVVDGKEEGDPPIYYLKPRRILADERKKAAPPEEKDAIERLEKILNSVVDPAVAEQMATLCMQRRDALIEIQEGEETKEQAITLGGVSFKE